MGWESISGQSMSEGSEFIKSEEQSGHCEHSRPAAPDRPGRVGSFCGLIASFYSLKAKKTPAGRLALGAWLGHCALVTQLCPTLQPHGLARQAPLSMEILQARILEWVAISSSRGSSQPWDRTQVSCIAGGFFTV